MINSRIIPLFFCLFVAGGTWAQEKYVVDVAPKPITLSENELANLPALNPLFIKASIALLKEDPGELREVNAKFRAYASEKPDAAMFCYRAEIILCKKLKLQPEFNDAILGLCTLPNLDAKEREEQRALLRKLLWVSPDENWTDQCAKYLIENVPAAPSLVYAEIVRQVINRGQRSNYADRCALIEKTLKVCAGALEEVNTADLGYLEMQESVRHIRLASIVNHERAYELSPLLNEADTFLKIYGNHPTAEEVYFRAIRTAITIAVHSNVEGETEKKNQSLKLAKEWHTRWEDAYEDKDTSTWQEAMGRVWSKYEALAPDTAETDSKNSNIDSSQNAPAIISSDSVVSPLDATSSAITDSAVPPSETFLSRKMLFLLVCGFAVITSFALYIVLRILSRNRGG